MLCNYRNFIDFFNDGLIDKNLILGTLLFVYMLDKQIN